MTAPARHLVVALVVVAAGCGLPFADGGDPTPSTAPVATSTPDRVGSGSTTGRTAGSGRTTEPRSTPSPTSAFGPPTPTPSPRPTAGDDGNASSATPIEAARPPGITAAGVENASRVLRAHTDALDRDGHVSTGRVDTTISRDGFVVDAVSSGRIEVASGSDRYYEVNRIRAGPVNRTVEMYANGSVEFRRTSDSSGSTVDRRRPRRPWVLASADLLEPYLRGGDFEVTGVDGTVDPPRFTLRANDTDNKTVLRRGLPDAAEEIRSFEATAVVDGTGRVRSLSATVEFVLADRNRTHQFDYELRQVGVSNVTRPGWVDDANVSRVAAAGPEPGPRPELGPEPVPGSELDPEPRSEPGPGPGFDERYCGRSLS